MNLERITEEYLKLKAHQEGVAAQVEQLKKMLVEKVDEAGVPDDNGHLWLTLDGYLLQRQKRQGKKYLNRARAEEWAKERGCWQDVMVIREELDEDNLLGYVFEHRRSEDPEFANIEAELESLYETPDPTWAFMPPVVQKTYDY